MLVKTAHARFSLRGHRGAGEARTSYLSIASPRRGPLLAAALLGQILDPGEGLDALRKPERRNGEQGDLLQLLGLPRVLGACGNGRLPPTAPRRRARASPGALYGRRSDPLPNTPCQGPHRPSRRPGRPLQLLQRPKEGLEELRPCVVSHDSCWQAPMAGQSRVVNSRSIRALQRATGVATLSPRGPS